jgi:hypothetical protein
LSGLLLAAVALFVIGGIAERSDEGHVEGTGTEHVTDHDGAAKHAEGAGAGDVHAEPSEVAESADSGPADDLTVLGVSVESTPLVVAAVVVSVVLALAVWWRRHRWLLWVTAGFAAVFALFDVAELVHQIREDRVGIAVVAAVIALLHAGAALVAEAGANDRRGAS